MAKKNKKNNSPTQGFPFFTSWRELQVPRVERQKRGGGDEKRKRRKRATVDISDLWRVCEEGILIAVYVRLCFCGVSLAARGGIRACTEYSRCHCSAETMRSWVSEHGSQTELQLLA
jgi:hypothetical protein